MKMTPITLHDSIEPAGLFRRGVTSRSRLSVAKPQTAATKPNWIQTNLATKQETNRWLD